MNQMAFRQLGLTMLLLSLFVLNFLNFGKAQQINLFHAPPDSAKSRVYWFWEFNRVTKAGITRDLEQFKAKHDLSLPKEKRIAKTHDVFRFDMLNANTPLLESGLLGPVKIILCPL